MKHIKKYNESGSFTTGDTYSCKIKPEIFYHGLSFNEYEINDVTCDDIILTYNIDMEVREFGIKSISIYNIKGPNKLPLNVSYYISKVNNSGQLDDDLKEEIVEIDINWENIKTEKTTEPGSITLNSVEIELGNDANYKLIAKSILVYLFDI